MRACGAKAFLINTGWNGQGKRISLTNTRTLINSIFSGEIFKSETETLPIFNLEMPKNLAGLDSSTLIPDRASDSPEEWNKRATYLAKLFNENFEKFTDTKIGRSLATAGPKLD